MDTPTNTNLDPMIKASSFTKSEVNKLLKNFAYFISVSLILCSLALLLTGRSYTIKSYFVLQICAFILGIVHTIIFFKFGNRSGKISFMEGFLYTTLIALVTITLLNFSFLLSKNINFPAEFNLSFIVFLIPFIFIICFELYIDIPNKKYTPWTYPVGKEVPVVEVLNSIKIKFYLSKKAEDEHLSEFELNVPTYVKLGDFIHYFFYRYNNDKNPTNPIMISPDNTGNMPYQWNFYKSRLKYFRSYLDQNKTIEQLKIQNNDVIYITRINNEPDFIEDTEINLN